VCNRELQTKYLNIQECDIIGYNTKQLHRDLCEEDPGGVWPLKKGITPSLPKKITSLEGTVNNREF
jgi:hypothetical protein